MEICWGFVATKVHHPAQGNLFMKQTPPPRSYNSALSMSSCWCFGQKLQFLVLFLLTQGSKTFLNSTCLSEFNMSISEWSSYTGGSADVKWSKKDLLDRIEEGENLSETSANGLNFMHVACRQGQVFTVVP